MSHTRILLKEKTNKCQKVKRKKDVKKLYYPH